ncbi:MAG: hypothetical protein KAR06_03290 [Deltaproteobacteria bacterium]|nr:hypothetical protein [Deltaproteobacteria bacterium]
MKEIENTKFEGLNKEEAKKKIEEGKVKLIKMIQESDSVLCIIHKPGASSSCALGEFPPETMMRTVKMFVEVTGRMMRPEAKETETDLDEIFKDAESSETTH